MCWLLVVTFRKVLPETDKLRSVLAHLREKWENVLRRGAP